MFYIVPVYFCVKFVRISLMFHEHKTVRYNSILGWVSRAVSRMVASYPARAAKGANWAARSRRFIFGLLGET